jgi:hypothetical protein
MVRGDPGRGWCRCPGRRSGWPPRAARRGRRVEGGEESGLVSLDGEYELGADGVEVLGVGALGVEGVL